MPDGVAPPALAASAAARMSPLPSVLGIPPGELGVAPKAYLPTYREFYERRWFAPGDDRAGSTIMVGGHEAPPLPVSLNR